jgi:hypothetical protein
VVVLLVQRILVMVVLVEVHLTHGRVVLVGRALHI